MSEQENQEQLQSLSDTLNRLAQKTLSGPEREEQRARLAAATTGFNEIASLAVDRIIANIGQVDQASKWIMSKMLRDAAVKDVLLAPQVVHSLYTEVAHPGDSGTRTMASGLLRDIGVAHEDASVTATTSLSLMLGQERDTGAKIAEKNALMTLAMKYEANAPIAVSAIGAALFKENMAGFRIQLSSDLREIGIKYPSQTLMVIKQLSRAAQKDLDPEASSHYAQDIARLALVSATAIPTALRELTAGYKLANANNVLSSYARAFTAVGQQSPAAVLSTIALSLSEDSLNGAHRRYLYSALGDLATMGGVMTDAGASILGNMLAKETDEGNRRVIIVSLTGAARYANDEGEKIKDVLKRAQGVEKNEETCKLITNSLRSMGYTKPVVSTVVPFPPAMIPS